MHLKIISVPWSFILSTCYLSTVRLPLYLDSGSLEQGMMDETSDSVRQASLLTWVQSYLVTGSELHKTEYFGPITLTDTDADIFDTFP